MRKHGLEKYPTLLNVRYFVCLHDSNAVKKSAHPTIEYNILHRQLMAIKFVGILRIVPS